MTSQQIGDLISKQAVLEMAYDMSEIDGEHFTEPCMVVDVEDIQKLPPKDRSVQDFVDKCRECGKQRIGGLSTWTYEELHEAKDLITKEISRRYQEDLENKKRQCYYSCPFYKAKLTDEEVIKYHKQYVADAGRFDYCFHQKFPNGKHIPHGHSTPSWCPRRIEENS